MDWNVPDWWQLSLLALAAFRFWRLIAEDTITARPRHAVIRKIRGFEEWITCPWCAGAWVTIGWWLAWVAWPHWSLVVATPFAISAIIGLIAANIDPV